MPFWRWEPCTLKQALLFRCLPTCRMFNRCTTYLCLLHHQFRRCWGSIPQWNGSIQSCLTYLLFARVCRSLLTTSQWLLWVISMIDSFTRVGPFLLFDLRFTVVLLERSFIWEKSRTPLAFEFGSFNQIFHWLLDLPHLLINRCKHGFEMVVG